MKNSSIWTSDSQLACPFLRNPKIDSTCLGEIKKGKIARWLVLKRNAFATINSKIIITWIPTERRPLAQQPNASAKHSIIFLPMEHTISSVCVSIHSRNMTASLKNAQKPIASNAVGLPARGRAPAVPNSSSTKQWLRHSAKERRVAKIWTTWREWANSWITSRKKVVYWDQ